ncbi:MAG: helix-turn-helix transcriptional regulator [Robiginitomaculum sp.]|nr:helix-turn-helix transcriptional regulator [Robiginitomaculum sp.]
MDSIGERIKQTRLSKGLSQVELASAVDVSQPTVANWENGSHIPRQAVFDRLSELLNAPLHWLIGGAQDQNGFTQISQQFLKTPIKHVPILNWPNCNDLIESKIEDGTARDYLTISTLAKKPFALVVNTQNLNTEFPIGTTIIFDADIDTMAQDSFYLFVDNQNIVLRQWHKPPRISGEQSMPLAKALLSVRPL